MATRTNNATQRGISASNDARGNGGGESGTMQDPFCQWGSYPLPLPSSSYQQATVQDDAAQTTLSSSQLMPPFNDSSSLMNNEWMGGPMSNQIGGVMNTSTSLQRMGMGGPESSFRSFPSAGNNHCNMGPPPIKNNSLGGFVDPFVNNGSTTDAGAAIGSSSSSNNNQIGNSSVDMGYSTKRNNTHINLTNNTCSSVAAAAPNTTSTASAATTRPGRQRAPTPRLLDKARFRRLIQVLLRYLQRNDPALRQKVKLTLRDYYRRPGADLDELQRRLRQVVGDMHWRTAEKYLAQIITNLAAKRQAERNLMTKNKEPRPMTTDTQETMVNRQQQQKFGGGGNHHHYQTTNQASV